MSFVLQSLPTPDANCQGMPSLVAGRRSHGNALPGACMRGTRAHGWETCPAGTSRGECVLDLGDSYRPSEHPNAVNALKQSKPWWPRSSTRQKEVDYAVRQSAVRHGLSATLRQCLTESPVAVGGHRTAAARLHLLLLVCLQARTLNYAGANRGPRGEGQRARRLAAGAWRLRLAGSTAAPQQLGRGKWQPGSGSGIRVFTICAFNLGLGWNLEFWIAGLEEWYTRTKRPRTE